MSEQRVILLGEKQTFLIRALIKKIKDSNVECDFVIWTIDNINKNWDNTALVILYMDEGVRPHEDVVHFLVDKMDETGNMMMIVGEKGDTTIVKSHIPSDLIYKTCYRPINNDEFTETVCDFMQKVEHGEFRKSILVVDDDTNYLGIVREWLKEDYKVSMANSGLQAIKWLGKNKADLILLDHEMPVTSGPKVLEMLRSDPETADIPVIFLTGKSDKESVMSVVALKPEGYFLKTIKKNELLENLNDFFIKRKA
ncbi:MAG: response regulator [Lachnospiraceae bacterium]|nr:response regulator [Lachnospiraceae bacterium]